MIQLDAVGGFDVSFHHDDGSVWMVPVRGLLDEMRYHEYTRCIWPIPPLAHLRGYRFSVPVVPDKMPGLREGDDLMRLAGEIGVRLAEQFHLGLPPDQDVRLYAAALVDGWAHHLMYWRQS